MARASRGTMRKWLALSAVVIALDLYTKHLVQQALVPGQHIPVTGFFDWVLFYNQGAAFSFLSNAGGWQRLLFSCFALAASGIIIHLLRKHAGQTLFCFSLSLILGGALGNLYDRVTLGHVVDFVFFHYQGYKYYWPAFNVADSAICVGAALLFWESFKKPQS
jgi:signal peptidase II